MANAPEAKSVRRIELKAARRNPSDVAGNGSLSLGQGEGAAVGKANGELQPAADQLSEKGTIAQTKFSPKGPAGIEGENPGKLKPRAVRDGDGSAAELMLNIEREARQSESEAELRFLMVNSTRRVVNYRQGFLLSKKGPKNYQVEAVSSLSAIDRNSIFIRWIEEIVEKSLQENGDDEVALIKINLDADKSDPDAKTYPFGCFVLLPLRLRDGTVFAQLVLSRENPWEETDVTAAHHLVETYSHTWQALTGPVQLKKRLRNKTLTAILTGVAIAAAGFLPIPLTVLAPAVVTATDPVVITAPMDAVLDRIEVLPNSMVKKGDLLFKFNDTDLRNRVDVAGQNVQVAEARYLQAQRNSFSDPRSKRDLAIMLSELKLKAAEYDYARDLLARTEVRAPQQGLVIFSDKDDWTGKPVSTGERIMRIANPSKVELTINLSVADSIVLEKQATVRLFMDSAPLHPLDAHLKSASYHARPDSDGVLSYRVVADFINQQKNAVPRIGLRGTAQIHGEEVPLAFFVFRKPLSVMRQWIGF